MIEESKWITARARRQQMLPFIQWYMTEHGFAPSMRDIGEHFKVVPSMVKTDLENLERNGYLTFQRKIPRSIVLKHTEHTA